ncbi:helix-turn-helix domain-containing protein [uncultured Allofournierella sp.]|nr:helix-turn-helix transcriptional regulator [uncultured Fournierella sp.]
MAQLRKEKRLTQREVAERLYVSDKAVSKWETGGSLR